MKATTEAWLAPMIGIPIGILIVYMTKLWMAPIPIEVFERQADKVQVTAGDVVTISWEEERNAHCSSTINRQLITEDGKIVNFEPIKSNVKPIARHADSFTFVVPPLATPGTMTYRVSTEFTCNWVQRLLGGSRFPLQDLKFEYVIPKGAG